MSNETQISDAQYNELCVSVQNLFGLANVNDAAFIVNTGLNFRDWLAVQFDDQQGGDQQYEESAFSQGDDQFAQGGEEFGDGDFSQGADDGFGGGEGDFGGGDFGTDDQFAQGEGDFGDGADLVFGDDAGDTDFGGGDDGFGGGEGDFGGGDFGDGGTDFGLDGGDGDFNFAEEPAPAPARQQARPAARPAAPAPAARPAAPAPAAQGRRPAAPAPAAPARGGQQQARPAAPAAAAPARAAAPAKQQAAADGYDAMKNGDLVKEVEERGLSAKAKAIKGDAATKRAAYIDLLRRFDKKVAQISATKDVAFLEGQMAKANLKVAYGRGRATEERKKQMLIGWLIAADVIKFQ